jgi:uncharacterized protein (TIGR02996 family)
MAETLLRSALERLEGASLEAALVALLDAWRASGGAPAVADAIDRVSDAIARNEAPIRASGGTSAKSAWYAAARSRRPAAIGRLLEALPHGADRAPRLRVLQLFPPDPRFGTFARRWLETPPVAPINAAPFFGEVMKLIAHAGDVRLAPYLSELTSPPRRERTIATYGAKNWKPLVELAAALAARAVPELDHEGAQLLARIDAILQQRSAAAGTDADVAALLDQVYADRDDDDARAVLADLLQQHGDPRGEFIALQLARAGGPPTTRERKLERTWGRTWLGALAPVVANDGLAFERGFVARCRYLGERDDPTSIGAREWSTVTHLDVAPATHFHESSSALLLSAPARGLRHVVGLGLSDLKALATAPVLPWHTVGWLLSSWDRREPLEHGAASVFPDARTLVLEGDGGQGLEVRGEDVAGLLAAWPQIAAFEIALANPSTTLVLAEALGPSPARLVVRTSLVDVALDRRERTIAIAVHHLSELVQSTIANVVRLPGFERATIRGTGSAVFDGTQLRRRHVVMAVAPIVSAAERAGVALSIQGRALT